MANVLEILEKEMTDLLSHCTTCDAINVHFSQYLLGQMYMRRIEDYEVYPEITPTIMVAKVHVVLSSDLTRYVLIITKGDNAKDAYDRAMGVV